MFSGSEEHHLESAGLPAALIRLQLNRILESDIFTRSERMSGFLRYIVERTLEGSGHTLKESVIAQDCFARGMDFDGAGDPIVRVEARRLRDKLREYYESAGTQPILIKLPKGSYLPSFERNAAAIPAVAQPLTRPEPSVVPERRDWARIVWAAGAIGVILIAGATWYGVKSSTTLPMRMRHLAHQAGNESSPGLSPDGNFVVFAWNNNGPADLFIKAVDNESVRRLTETPEPEGSPAWSPDGRDIAFIRAGRGVFTMSALGGAERKVAEIGLIRQGSQVGWSADSQSIFVNDRCPRAGEDLCIYQISLDTLQRRQVTNSDRSSDVAFAAAPDGQMLAVVRNMGRASVNDVFLVPLRGGDTRRLTSQNRAVDHVAWAPDGESVIYSVLEGARFRLWRTRIQAGSGNGEPLSPIGQYADMPSVARSSSSGTLRIAFRTRIHDVGLRVVALSTSGPGPAHPVGTDMPFADTTEGRDCSARFSPDAKQVAFYSIRTGEPRLWIANRDGSGLRTLSTMAAQELKPGGWSPDGHRLAFDADFAGNSDIYITDSAGSQPYRLTSEPSLEASPSWSTDSRWIYFASDRSGSFQVWKVRAEGGPAVQVTFRGGFKPQPSPDGKYVYFVESNGSQQPLKRITTEDGQESVVLDRVFHHNAWSVSAKGIYLLEWDRGVQYLDLYDPTAGRRTRLGTLPFQVARPTFCGFISASQDGNYLIANHADRDETDLGLLELR